METLYKIPFTLFFLTGNCEATSAPFTVTVADPVDPPVVSFDIVNCQPYKVELTASNSQNGTFNWSNGTTGSPSGAWSGGSYKVTFTSIDGCTSENYIDVPKSPSEYLWIFPTGCFCGEDLDFETKTCFSHFHGPFITGPIIPFSHWGYFNGNNELTGTNSIPSAFANFIPGKINLVIDNGYCQAISGEMFYSHNCPNFGPEVTPQNKNASPGLGTPDDKTNQNTESVEPLLLLIPNPAAHQTQIQYRFEDSESRKSIEIYDMTGRKMKTLIPENSAGSIALSLNGYTGGIYEICLRQNGSVIAQTKLSVTP